MLERDAMTEMVRSSRVVDVGVAAALGAWVLTEAAMGPVDGPRLVAAIGGLAMCLPLVWRRTRPVPVALVVAVAFVAEGYWGVDTRTQVSSMAILPVAAYALGAYAPPLVGTCAAGVLVLSGTVSDGPPSVSGLAFALVVVGASWGGGWAMRGHRARTQSLSSELDRSREHAAAAAAEERSRIALELHDIVAHTVSIMVIQAAAASEVLRRDPDGAERALASVQVTGREALEELRRLVGILRADGNDADLDPQPGLGDLADLVERARAAGLIVTLCGAEGVGALPASLQLSIYRIVQEGLTNTLKHASATHVEVQLARHGDLLTVRVSDDGHGVAASTAATGGHGLVGVRERAALFGGTVTTATAPSGGFTLEATLPVTTTHTVTP